MTKYRRNQTRLKALDNDTLQMRAAVNLVIAVKDGIPPDADSLNVLADAFLLIFGGKKHPIDIFGSSLGLVRPSGRPADYGFTPADIVSAFIELERRKAGNGRGALAAAKRKARDSFVDIDGADPLRAIERDWREGRTLAESLSDAELEALIRPYEY